MKFELERCSQGTPWFPWNYGRKVESVRVGMRRFEPEPGLTILNAVTPTGSVLGSCSFRVGYRHADYLLNDEEFQYGAFGASRPYFWPDDETPWIMTLKSFWVRPEVRRAGIARAFAEHARDIGLPAYLAFANDAVREWFDREFRPSKKRSKIQRTIERAASSELPEEFPMRPADFTVHFQAEAPAMLVWRAYRHDDEPGLEQALFSPDRMDEWAADSGTEYEPGFSDSALAEDRSFGYFLEPMTQSWGPTEGPFDSTEDSGDFEAAEADYEKKSEYAAGIIEGWITGPDSVLSYATVRRFLRTLETHHFESLEEAIDELFVRDLTEMPRGLRRFEALASPVNQVEAEAR